MTLDRNNLKGIAAQAARILENRFDDWESPRYLLHADGAFELDGLLDGPPQELALADLPELPQKPNTDGESPRLAYGRCHGIPLLILQNPWRTADGNGLLPALFPILLARTARIPNALFLDCALSLTPDLKAGHWGMLTDFLNSHACSPLDGLHDLLERPFPNLAETLDQFQNSEILNALGTFGETPLLCNYLGVPGHHLATPAEARVARAQGADLLGHDLPLLLIFAHAMGFRVSALVLAIAQFLPELPPPRVTRREFLETAQFCSPQLVKTIRKALANLEHRPDLDRPPAEIPAQKSEAQQEMDADELIAASIRAAATRHSPLAKYLRR
ncbi:MAG: hypothetical protein J6Y80_03960 [Victivallales bacterium]|nr:hypothetical protein [Victivallales bacterium]